MKRMVKTLLAGSLLVAAVLGAPAMAQNAGQVSRAQNGASCPKCNLFQADFNGRTLKGKNFAGARLRQADFGLGIFNGSNLAGTDLRDINGSAALFGHVNFSRANLTNANFVGAYLEHANFRGANLSGVNFSGAEMSTATGLTQRQMDQACGDKATELPAGIRIPVCKIQ
ncbi:MAG: pentapeptide repeat-containing protein [Asticcacaulis sp.]